MGKGKKIERGTKYNLVYRSSTDALHEGEETPSEMVLTPAITNNQTASALRRGVGVSDSAKTTKHSSNTADLMARAQGQDHVNELGLPNDGYDYSQHLRSMGQGKFIGADGKERVLPEKIRQAAASGGQGFDIPTELQPSARELNRRLETVTLDDRVMDEDLRAALFDDADAEGEGFEELLDDFVLTAMSEPEEAAFDWDAHMAMLISRSEGMSGVGTSKVRPRGWENESGAGAKAAARHAIAGDGDIEEGEEYDSDDSGFIPSPSASDDEAEAPGVGDGAPQSLMQLTAQGLAHMSLNNKREARKRSGSGDVDADNMTAFSDDRRSRQSKGSMTSVYTRNGTKVQGRFNVRSNKRTLAEEKIRQERIFEATLEEYGEDDIGDLEHLYYEEEDEEEEESDSGAEDDAALLAGEDPAQTVIRLAERAKRRKARAERAKQRVMCGVIDVEDLEQHPMMDEALNDFLQAQEAEEYLRGITPKNRVDTTEVDYDKPAGAETFTAEDYRRAAEASEQLQLEREEEIRENMASSKRMMTMKDIALLQTTKFEMDTHKELEECQAYLEETREEQQWDCETVLSTYSTLDNHPKLLKEPKNSKFKVHKSRFTIRREGEERESDQLSMVEGGREALTQAAYSASKEVGGMARPDRMQPSRITLSGKLLLPDGYGGDVKNLRKRRDDDGASVRSGQSTSSSASRFTVQSNVTGRISLGSASAGGTSIALRMPAPALGAGSSKAHRHSELRHGLATLAEETAAPRLREKKPTEYLQEGEEGEEDSGEDSMHSSEDGLTTGTATWTLASRKAETPEQKKIRKAAAKEQQSLRRKNKKTMRGIYSEEQGKAIRADGKRSTLEHVSVFRY